MTNKTDYKLISFDIWGTLLKSNPEYVKARGELFSASLGVEDLVHLKKIKDEVDLELDGKSEVTGDDFNFRSRISLMIDKLGKKQEDYNDKFYDELREKLNTLFILNPPSLIEPKTAEFLKELKEKGLKIAAVSNTGFLHGDAMREMFKKIGLFDMFDYFIFSNEVGFAKPNPTVFENLISISGCLAQEMIHVGDSIRADYTGSYMSGLHSVLFDPKTKHGNRFFSIKNITEVLNILNENLPILHHTSFSLYQLKSKESTIVDQFDKTFDFTEYSKFKYGDGIVARHFGHQLAKSFIEENPTFFDFDIADVVITTSPYKNIVKGSLGIAKSFKNYINQYLFIKGKPSIVDIPILKKDMFQGDYGTFSDEKRKELMHKNDLFIMDEYVQNKRLILIDDARITGSHEENMVNFLKNKKLKDVRFLYITDMEVAFAKENPDIEDKMNHGWVDSLDKLSDIMNSREFILNARVCKFILSQENAEQLTTFIHALSDSVLYDLYNGVIGDGYAMMPLYTSTFNVLRTEIENRGIFSK